MFYDPYEEANKENVEGLPFIDNGKRKLFYRFSPSKTNPIGAPLYVILHGHGTKKATKFQKDGWNILAPIDHFGKDGKGCWWLGENGDFFVKELLQSLIKKTAQKYQCEDKIYFYGSSMGGYGAILHGVLSNACAVYANVPQIKLLGTTYSNRMMKKYFLPIFSQANQAIENDLTLFVKEKLGQRKLPLFLLCENIFSSDGAYENYLKEHTYEFMNFCIDNKIKAHIEFLPKSGHDKNYGLKDVIDKFFYFESNEENINNMIINSEKGSIMKEKKNLNIFEMLDLNFKSLEKYGKVKFSNTGIESSINLSSSENAIYVESEYIQIIENKNVPIQNIKISIDAIFEKTKLSIYILEYDNDLKKISSKSYRLKNGKNTFLHICDYYTNSFKILIRFDNDNLETITLKNFLLSFDSIFDIEEHIIKLQQINKKSYLFVNYKKDTCNSYHFKPRSDVKEYQIKLPIEWDVNPFKDNNWMFQLNALRMLDSELIKYYDSKDEMLLKRAIEIVLDWKRDVIDEKKYFDIDHEKDLSNFAWHDMATGLRAIKIAFIFESIIKLGKMHSFYQYKEIFFSLILLHIKVLSNQKVAPGNHAIFQIHGLMMLLRLFPDTIDNIHTEKLNTEKRMSNIFYEQFFHEGIHRENSANYHTFILNTFKNILIEDIYPDLQEIFIVLERAKENCAYMHFPNLESLMTGDSDYKLHKPLKEEKMKEGITHFKESGYTYIYEKDYSESMLFMDTAFLNRTHKHADFFNILLYEFGMNILVDAGKYSYMKDNPFRKYCISTRAHNTVLINNEDYKLDRKYFFESRLKIYEKRKTYYYLKTEHSYSYLGVMHQRHVFYVPGVYMFVVDVMSSEKEYDYKQLFHLHQSLNVEERETYLESVINQEVTMYIQMQTLKKNTAEAITSKTFSKGLGGEVEGYRALGHNEVIENHVLDNSIVGENVVLATMFSFVEKVDFSLVLQQENIHIIFGEENIVLKG